MIDVDAVTVQADAAPVRRPLSYISLKDTTIVEIRTDTVSERSSEPGVNYINKEIMKINEGTQSARPFTRDRLVEGSYTVSLNAQNWLQDAAMVAKKKAEEAPKGKQVTIKTPYQKI